MFGRDYDTPDGTCIRDYVHVVDLCQAHLLALAWLEQGQPSAAFNLGNGSGFSVLEVIEAVRRVTQQPVPVEDAPRRAGDPARLVVGSDCRRRSVDVDQRKMRFAVFLDALGEGAKMGPRP